MYKSVHSKDWRWCFSISTIPQWIKNEYTKENLSERYKNGFHKEHILSMRCTLLTLTIRNFMIEICFPNRKK